jgi:uncharacterized protein
MTIAGKAAGVFGAVALSTLLAGAARADSIDCAKAAGRIDRLVCADRALMRLDADLDQAYGDAFGKAADRSGLLKAQRAWLKARDACADAPCLSALYSRRIEALRATPSAGWKTWRDPRLGLSFEYFGNRRVKPCRARLERCVMLVDRALGIGETNIQFEVFDGGLEKTARDQHVFELEGDRWMIHAGPGQPQETERFSGPGWRGMRASIICGVDLPKSGYHAAAGECLWAVLSNGRRSVVVRSDGFTGGDEKALRSVTTLKFVR